MYVEVVTWFFSKLNSFLFFFSQLQKLNSTILEHLRVLEGANEEVEKKLAELTVCREVSFFLLQ